MLWAEVSVLLVSVLKCTKKHHNDVTQGDEMNEMHLIIGSVVAAMVLVASVVDLYQLTHSDLV